MAEKRKIIQYREMLDKTLASPDLVDEETLRTLVKNQLLHSSGHAFKDCNENVVGRRTAEVSNFLEMLRSASVNDHDGHPEWKLKQDNEEFRVMYREGPKGTPFHTLLVEGYVDGPVDICLCISWESELYPKWWPQTTVPTFRIISSKCLQKVRVGEQISLIRMKVSWPLSAREVVIHYFLFEYARDGLIVVLLNSISDLESIDEATHGFTSEAIPEAKEVVRIDVVGGFAIQKVTSERSYFRTIANMDMKLDFVPPSLINFVARQLVGIGFKLYQKAVTSKFKNDGDLTKALGDLLYARIRESICRGNKQEMPLEDQEMSSDRFDLPVQHLMATKDDDQNMSPIHSTSEPPVELKDDDQNMSPIHCTSEPPVQTEDIADKKGFGEIEEEEGEERKHSEDRRDKKVNYSISIKAEKCHRHGKRNIAISSDVEKALGTLDTVIHVVREYGLNSKTPPWGMVEEAFDVEKDIEQTNGETGISTMEEVADKASQNYRRMKSGSKDGNNGRIAPEIPDQNLSTSSESNQSSLILAKTEKTEAPKATITKPDKQEHQKQTSKGQNGVHENSLNIEKQSSNQKKHRNCCFVGF